MVPLSTEETYAKIVITMVLFQGTGLLELSAEQYGMDKKTEVTLLLQICVFDWDLWLVDRCVPISKELAPTF